jgi:aldehyde dehydrogenase (NAD+)
MLAWKIAPALAAGNTVVLKPAEYTSLTALLFADICREAGLPKGVVNIVTGDGATGQAIVEHPGIAKIAFTGSTAVGRSIRETTAGTGKSLTLELGGKSPYIVFDDADIDSAIEGLVDAIWFNQGQVCCAGSRLFVQEGIAEDFHTRLKARMDKLRVGDPLDKCIDVGAVVDPVQHAAITRLVDANTEGEVYRAATDMPAEGCFYPPTLITGLSPAAPLMQEEIFGPVLVSGTFRTPAEAVQLANNTRYGLAATLWTENLNLALDIAPKLAAGVVWVNATNLFDAAAPFGGVRESGFGREGGWEGMQAYLKPDIALKPAKPVDPAPAARDRRRPRPRPHGQDVCRRQAGAARWRLFAAVYSKRGKLLGHAGIGNRKDIRNAVEAARGASGWAKATGHLRAQILYYIAENLSARADEFAARIRDLTGTTAARAEAEVATSVDRLFTYAAWADKFDGVDEIGPDPGRGAGHARTRRRDRPSRAGRRAASRGGLPSGAGHRDGQPRGARAVLARAARRDRPLPGARHLGRAGRRGQHRHRRPGRAWAHARVPSRRGCALVLLADGSTQGDRGGLGRKPQAHLDQPRRQPRLDVGRGRGRRFLDAATEVKTIWVPYGE